MFGRRYTYTIFAPPFPPFSFLSIILYLYTEKGTLFPAPFLPFPHVPYILFYYIYSIYRGIHFPATFPAPSLPFIILLLYIEEETFYPPPFSPYIYSYKVNTFSTAHFLTLIVLGKGLRGKVFENFISIVL